MTHDEFLEKLKNYCIRVIEECETCEPFSYGDGNHDIAKIILKKIEQFERIKNAED